jgi:hypothetical protein
MSGLRRVAVLAAVLLEPATGAQAHSAAEEPQDGAIALICETIARPAVEPARLYKVPPATRQELIADLWDAGRAGLVSGPAEIWIIDPAKNTVVNGLPGIAFRDVSISGSIAQGFVTLSSGVEAIFKYNNYDGTLLYGLTYPAGSDEKWTALHGGILPDGAGWKQQCTALKPPA